VPLIYRPARADDLERADALTVGSINDLTERHGFGPMATASPPRLLSFSLRDDPEGLWVAEDNGEMRGFAFSWTCGDLWFLAQLFIAPDQQGRGIGRELIKRTLAHADKSGAGNRALITFTFNRVSQGLYIRHGLYPRFPIYFFSVDRELLAALPDSPLRAVPMSVTTHERDLAAIDRAALGTSRAKHHAYLVADEANTGVMLYDGDHCAGYAYLTSTGHIGPLAVARAELAGPAFAAALKLAATGRTPQVSAFIPGAAEAPLSLAVARGMRITFPMVLMTNRDFGDWRCYLPRNPGFM
jgi:ribosomal protein S18 acetylase RimI-like enzyme